MKNYGIYLSPIGQYEAVKHGFAYPGLFFGFLWLGYKGMLVRGMIFLFVYAILGNLIYGMESDPTFLNRGLMSLISIFQHPPLIENKGIRLAAGLTRTILIGLIIGAFGNDWHRRRLVAKGYSYLRDIEAPTRKAALCIALPASCQIKLPKAELQEARKQIVASLSQDDRLVARDEYVRLVGLISSPWVVSQGRNVVGTEAIQRWLNIVIVLGRLYWLGLCAIIAGILVWGVHFLWLLPAAALWWVLYKVQLRLNVELAARWMVFLEHGLTQAQACPEDAGKTEM